jgi:indolepyruvate ferredoxin oxidoreductase alpha subunit
VPGAHGALRVDAERCNLCGLCLAIGCPALARGEGAVEATEACTGCGVCVEACHRGALQIVGADPEKPA